jgi:hypothetical protein
MEETNRRSGEKRRIAELEEDTRRDILRVEKERVLGPKDPSVTNHQPSP